MGGGRRTESESKSTPQKRGLLSQIAPLTLLLEQIQDHRDLGALLNQVFTISVLFQVLRATCITCIAHFFSVQTTMVTTGSPNPVQNKSKTIIALAILSMQHPLPLSWKGASTLRLPSGNHLIKKTLLFTWIPGVHESPNFIAQARKAGQFSTLSTPVSHSIDSHWM